MPRSRLTSVSARLNQFPEVEVHNAVQASVRVGDAEDLIREAPHSYADDVVIATKAGLLRTGPDVWEPLGNPSYLRQEVEMSLRRLGVDRIDLHQLHRIDPNFPLEDQVGELATLQQEGKIRHIGLSE